MNDIAPVRPPYRVLADPCEHTLEEKRSLFHTCLFPVRDREEAMAQLAAVRTNHPGASHYCWAYVLGPADQPHGQAFNDDGEPSGTAGKPMLHVLTQRGAGDCLAVVVRTFGGTKLGAGGLVRAYSGAVSGALNQARWRDITPTHTIGITVDFALEERLRHMAGQRHLAIDTADYGQAVTLTLQVPDAELTTLHESVRQITRGRFQWRGDYDD